MTAEFGRQLWIVYELLRTSEGISPSVRTGEVWASVIGFGLIYALLFVLFIYLLDRKIRHGPEEAEELEPSGVRRQRLTTPHVHREVRP
jgi:cytochrome d ubiquinol oxidase subunit I